MEIKFNKRTGRLEVRTKKKLILVSFYAWEDCYYLIPTVRLDIRRKYGETCLWLFFMGMFLLIDIFKIKE